jgi:hypothetical protein
VNNTSQQPARKEKHNTVIATTKQNKNTAIAIYMSAFNKAEKIQE